MSVFCQAFHVFTGTHHWCGPFYSIYGNDAPLQQYLKRALFLHSDVSLYQGTAIL